KEEIKVELVSAEGARMITSGDNQLKLEASGKLDLTRTGIILIPGVSCSLDDSVDSIPAKLKQATETELSPLLKSALAQPDLLVATVCGGSLILAMDGLLEGRHAVTHHMGMDLLSATEAIAIHARVVDDGNLVTSGGVTSGLDLALYLIERELGPRIAHAVEQFFEYERRGTVWKNVGNTLAVTHDQVTEPESELPIIPYIEKIKVEGKWDTIISTPLGDLSVLVDLAYKDNKIIGTARQEEEITALINPILKGNLLMWSMKVTKPMRLTLKFNVFIEGNNMHGEAKAGILPASKLIGHRVI
ncbi:MAG: DJ-1/PfpI family protein, partial [Heyndrickxia sp.]